MNKLAMEEEIILDKQVKENQFMEEMLDNVINYRPPPKNNNYKNTKSNGLQRGYKYEKFQEIIEHKEYVEAMREFEEQIKNPANNYFMSFYKASYDGEFKEVLPYLRKAYYENNDEKPNNKKRSKNWGKNELNCSIYDVKRSYIS